MSSRTSAKGTDVTAALPTAAAWAVDRVRFPERVLDMAKLGILDVIASALAARCEPVADVVLAASDISPSAVRTTILGRRAVGSAQQSAFVNGTLAHALDFDDSSADLGGHPSAVVLPAALAVAQARGATGQELLEAYCVGVEVTCAFGRALNPAHYDRGWHPTATIGAFGATVAAGRLLGLNPEQLAQALGLTAAFSSGIKASFGTLAKPLQVGRAAMNGVASAELVRVGATASASAFEHPQGFLTCFQSPGEHAEIELPGDDTETWSLTRPGLIIKRYPCCGSTHSAIEAALAVRTRIRPDEIAGCQIRVHPRRLGHVDRPDPRSGLDCKFSLQYTVARALLSGMVRLEDFEGAAPFEPRTRDLMRRITVDPVENAPDDLPEDRFIGIVTVQTCAGDEVTAQVPIASGRTPGQMLPEEAFWEKFELCTRRALSPERTGQLRDQVIRLDRLESVDGLVATTCSDRDAPHRPNLAQCT